MEIEVILHLMRFKKNNSPLPSQQRRWHFQNKSANTDRRKKSATRRVLVFLMKYSQNCPTQHAVLFVLADPL